MTASSPSLLQRLKNLSLVTQIVIGLIAGIALALGAAFLYAIAALIIKRLKDVPPHLMALIQVTTGALLLAPMVPWNSLPATTNAWAALVTLGVVHTGLMYVLLYGAIQKLLVEVNPALPLRGVIEVPAAEHHRHDAGGRVDRFHRREPRACREAIEIGSAADAECEAEKGGLTLMNHMGVGRGPVTTHEEHIRSALCSYHPEIRKEGLHLV